MEDAAEKLDELARAARDCTRCSEIVSRRLRALAGKGHPHAHVMFVSLFPSAEEEALDLPAGSAVARELAEFVPALTNGGRDKSYFTTLVKCVPRSDSRVRRPRADEKENCYGFLSTEISIMTPHYIVPIGDETARFLLGKLFKTADTHRHDPMELRAYESPSFRVVPIAAPADLRKRGADERSAYLKQLHSLTALMGL